MLRPFSRQFKEAKAITVHKPFKQTQQTRLGSASSRCGRFLNETGPTWLCMCPISLQSSPLALPSVAPFMRCYLIGLASLSQLACLCLARWLHHYTAPISRPCSPVIRSDDEAISFSTRRSNYGMFGPFQTCLRMSPHNLSLGACWYRSIVCHFPHPTVH